MARSSATAKGRRAVIVAGLRTPFVKAGTDFAQLDVLDLARAVTVELLLRTGVDPNDVDHVIYGNVTRPVQYTNLARELVLSAGLPRRTPADTVTLACASACQAITDATNLIERGYADVVWRGVEMLSNVPIALSCPWRGRWFRPARRDRSAPACRVSTPRPGDLRRWRPASPRRRRASAWVSRPN
jgi:acetyl-CoA acyltransferase